MIAWLLVACVGTTPPDTADTSGGEDSADTGSNGIVRNQVSSPAEAVDIDADPSVVHIELAAAPHTHTIGDLVVDGYAYNGQTPGPTIRARVGDTLIVDLTNELDATTTIHWHGAAVPYEMDGVVWTLGGVEPGETFRYTFEAVSPGTFWYHPHVDTAHQVDHGLYGVLIIEDPAEPEVDEELVLVFDDWKQSEAEHPNARPEGLWTVNGVTDPYVELAGGQRVRTRMLNASNHGYLDLSWPEMRWISGDQGLLPSPQTPERLQLTPGDRAEVEWLPGQESWTVLDRADTLAGPGLDTSEERLFVEVTEPTAPASPTDWPFPGGETVPSDAAADIVYVFTGEGDDWFINGERFPDVTVETLTLQAESIIEVRNLSGVSHPFHLHGMHFEVLQTADIDPGFQRIEDTWNIAAYQTARFRVLPRYPGFWMAHCHILEHADGGMMTVIEVPAAR